eukprot:2449904-Karenia_brevis.AAC.1
MMGLESDVSKVHRRCKIHKDDQRWQTGRSRPEMAWVNTVGMLGVGSAGCWWARLGGGLGRLVYS